MTFEEKYAAQGRKLDELKAKLDAAIDARKLAHEQKCEELEAALDKFDAALDAQIEKQYDTLDAQIGKQCDTLDAEINKQCDTMERRAEMLDAQIDKQCDTIDAQIDKQFDTMEKRVDKLDAKVEEQAAKAKAAFTLDKATAESVANEPTGINAVQKQTAGEFAAAEENARLIRERRDAKCSNAKLRTEMKVNAAKEKLAERREERDKAAQEQWIFDLLEYAEGCYEMAIAWALEAEYTLMEADYEIDYYNKKFGENK